MSPKSDVSKPAVAYYRVSDPKQGRSGLGLEAQRESVARYARSEGFEVVAEFTEVETGTSKRRRSEIVRAIERSRAEGAMLLIARLDRLARNVHFTSGLLESKVNFVAVDMPYANTFTVHVMAAVAQQAAERISEDTKAALAAARARGVTLGTPNLTPEARARGAAANAAAALEADRRVAGYVGMMREAGWSLRAIADRLNQEGHRTRKGRAWSAVQVRRVLLRRSSSTPSGGASR